MRGGVDEELAERNRWIQAEQKKINDSVTALINKRKLCKPVETSEKEATDKKKKKEEEEEKEEEEAEEVATKSSARTATKSSGLVRTSFVKVWYRIRALNNIITIGPVGYLIIPRKTRTPSSPAPIISAMMNTPKLDLERKKKSEARSFLGSCDSPSSSSSSSSADEQLASDEENEYARQKGGEESDGRRPMAEQERKVSDGNNEELLLPWKAKVCDSYPLVTNKNLRRDTKLFIYSSFDKVREEIRPRTLIEEIAKSERHVADDAERKCQQIWNNCKSAHDSLDVCIINGETTASRKVILESQREKEKTADLQASISGNNVTNDRKNERPSTCSISCDTSDLKQVLEENHKFANTVTMVNDDVSNKNTQTYQKKGKKHPFGSKLSSIREEMKEFCDSMDRFVDENRIVFKNGEVEGFWGERKVADENLQTDFIDDSKIQESETKVSASEEDELRWWCTKERKLKVMEILKKREDEAKRNKVETENTEMNEKSDRYSSKDKKQPTDITDDSQGVYDLMTLKTCLPNALSDSAGTYSVKDAGSYECEQSTKMDQEESREVFSSLFAELRNRDCVKKVQKPKVSTELMVLEERLDHEKSAIDTEKKSVSTLIDVKDFVDSDEQSLKRENIVQRDYCTEVEILEGKVNDLSFELSEGKKNIDESDDDSFKTAMSVQEDSQFSEGNYDSLEILKLTNTENNLDKIIELSSVKNENIDHSIDNRQKEVMLNKEHNDAIYVDKINDETEKLLDKMEILATKRGFSAGTEKSNSQVKSLVRKMDHLSLERTSRSSRLIGKRIREAEDIEVSNKKSFLIEKISPGRKSPEERKSRSQISERCRQHLIKETKKFAKKVSPLIDTCITNLIKEAENAGEKSQCYKYERRSLGEYLPSDFVSMMDLSKPAGDFKKRDNCRDKYGDKSSDVTDTYSERQELSIGQTFNLESTKSANSDIQSLANLLRQSENCKPESTAINDNISLYKEFCDHLHELESKKELLIKPDFTIDQDSKELLSENKLSQETECSIKKSVKPLIEVISTTSKDSEQSFEQKEIKQHSHNSQTTFHCQQNNVVLGESKEMVQITDDFEEHINQESALNSKKEIKVETCSTSCSVEITECKKECVLPNEECKTVTTNMKKSIEMQVAQEN
ncbi:LOW QUALITY PROTEIN: uncharacterized protein LOC105837923 [Monomorium pharaonis]|uniref:LOW QUALITY PROTEIN: uncharacterized protein LOC105837923 n=1 Tax=Monomorium pharaonis TaxID=307658 RepID=UPI0017468DCA|nr:LOW QUALITY PROTEIN: uncharacterized protein LOC105837923 [Monomorium pharaonis]